MKKKTKKLTEQQKEQQRKQLEKEVFKKAKLTFAKVTTGTLAALSLSTFGIYYLTSLIWVLMLSICFVVTTITFIFYNKRKISMLDDYYLKRMQKETAYRYGKELGWFILTALPTFLIPIGIKLERDICSGKYGPPASGEGIGIIIMTFGIFTLGLYIYTWFENIELTT